MSKRKKKEEHEGLRGCIYNENGNVIKVNAYNCSRSYAKEKNRTYDEIRYIKTI